MNTTPLDDRLRAVIAGNVFDRNMRFALSASLAAIGQHGRGTLRGDPSGRLAKLLIAGDVLTDVPEESGVFAPANDGIKNLLAAIKVGDDGFPRIERAVA